MKTTTDQKIATPIRSALFAASALLIVFRVTSVSAVQWYVDAAVAEPADGTMWTKAFSSIQEGIDASSDGDTVFVAPGTYIENVRFNGKNIILTSTNPLDPAVVVATIIDGNKAGSVVLFDGTEDDTSVLSGFTIQNGKADQGGGICGGTAYTQTLATIRNNFITGNRADKG